MGELAAMIDQRIAEASESLRTARAEDDAFLVDAREAEIDDLRRIANEHGIDPKADPDRM
ncbi:MAG TPA: hypothetical protein VE465_28715 [Streptosporangiaceae bacterium]|jgi:hypothetical protein|nr:hypothetical protein [Streptosporangiaceae bacterium]